MKKRILKLVHLSLSLMLFSISAPAFSWVKDISLERVFVGEDVRVHEVGVKCRIEQKPRVLRKVVSSDGLWCSVDLPKLCSEQKISAARKLCSYGASEFRNLVQLGAESTGEKAVVKNSNQANVINVVAPSVAASKAELIQEQMLIEERRIKIEQRRIELSRKEVALKKVLTQMMEMATLDAS